MQACEILKNKFRKIKLKRFQGVLLFSVCLSLIIIRKKQTVHPAVPIPR